MESMVVDVVEKRDGWDNKVQYILAQIGFAVGRKRSIIYVVRNVRMDYRVPTI